MILLEGATNTSRTATPTAASDMRGTGVASQVVPQHVQAWVKPDGASRRKLPLGRLAHRPCLAGLEPAFAATNLLAAMSFALAVVIEPDE